MYNHPRIIRHQKAKVSEEKPTPKASIASSLAETTGAIRSPKLPEVEQSIESVPVPTLAERCLSRGLKAKVLAILAYCQVAHPTNPTAKMRKHRRKF